MERVSAPAGKLVIDAATLYPRYNRGGSLHALDVIDGATIKPLIGEDGRAPEPPDPDYQQILKVVQAADFSVEELLYLPRNVRAHRLYGMSRSSRSRSRSISRSAATQRRSTIAAGSTPDAFATLPKGVGVHSVHPPEQAQTLVGSGRRGRQLG